MYFFNTSWLFLEKILRIVAAVFIGAYVARFLGPEQYGILVYCVSLVSLVNTISILGLETIVVRELVLKSNNKDTIMGTAFLLRAAGTFVLLVAIFIICELTQTNERVLIYILSLGLLGEVFSIINYYFQSQAQAKFIVWSQLIALVIISALRILFVVYESPLAWFALTFALDFIIYGFGLFYFYSRSIGSPFSWKFDSKLAKQLMQFSWPVILSGMATTIYLKIDQVMVKWMLGDEATGNYGVAVRLSEMWYFIPLAICGSTFPAIIKAKQVSAALYHHRMQRLLDLMVLISIGIALPATFVSDFVIEWLFGSAYSEAGGLLSLYIWSSVFVFIGVANSKWIFNENLQLSRMWILVVAAILNIGLNFILLKMVGLYGAAYATLISYALATYLGYAFSKQTRILFVQSSRALSLIGIVVRLWKDLTRPISTKSTHE